MTKQLDTGEETKKLQSSDDLALAALGDTPQTQPSDEQDEVAASDQLAETLTALQQVIERKAQMLERLKKDVKQKREMLKDVFTNDTQLSEAQEQAKELTTKVKERRAQVTTQPEVSSLKVQIGSLKEEQVEIEEDLSNLLVKHFGLTGAKSFDTSGGDQWEYELKAKVKPQKRK